ncbi:DUF72 domain-containing protein, partial [Pseudomonas viridiflava]
WEGVRYWRLHGSPQIYHSPYGADRLAKIAEQLRRSGQEGAATWCLFDNTASGAAVGDALGLQELLTD